MQWHQVTAIYVIGNRYPAATFTREDQAEKWAEATFPGEWLKKTVKIPPLPLTSKASQRNLKNLAAVLDNMEWEAETDDDVDALVIDAKPPTDEPTPAPAPGEDDEDDGVIEDYPI